MKDMLGRDIVVGDTLAYVDYDSYVTHRVPSLATIKVVDSSAFALLLVREAAEDKNEYRSVIENADSYVICDWAK